jgi:hypothetical protein
MGKRAELNTKICKRTKCSSQIHDVITFHLLNGQRMTFRQNNFMCRFLQHKVTAMEPFMCQEDHNSTSD